jgi:CheY-like chemotaxis protein
VPALRSPLAGVRLLFVDDEPTLRSGMEAFGRLRGFTVVTAGDGGEALSQTRALGVDAVVCDLRMPGMDGYAFHDQLRAERDARCRAASARADQAVQLRPDRRGGDRGAAGSSLPCVRAIGLRAPLSATIVTLLVSNS